MNYNSNDFYESETKKLKANYIASYSYSPGLYGNMRTVNLFIDAEFNYSLFVFFHENPDDSQKISDEFFKSPRTFIEYKSKLPIRIRILLTELLKPSKTSLKSSYYNDKNLFGILDRTEKYYEIRLNDKYYSIEMSLDAIDKKHFTTKTDQLFLQLTEATEIWLDQLIDGFVNVHNAN